MDEPDDKSLGCETVEDRPDVDLYCLECGYNLRGLSGDPRRCPECGYQNPLSQLALPASLIVAQLRRMESAPVRCIVGELVLCLTVGILIAAGGFPDPSINPGGAICFGLPILGSIVFCVTGCVGFRNSCESKPGWAMALAWFHFYAFGTMVPMLALIAVAMWTTLVRNSCVMALLIPGYIALAAWWLKQRLARTIYPLQRQMAVTIARRYWVGKRKT